MKRRLPVNQQTNPKRSSEDRYEIFFKQSSEGIWRFTVDEPIPIELPADQQIELFFQYGYLAECNDAMAKMYGLQKSTELEGRRLSQFFPKDKDSEDYFNYFIQSGYRAQDVESKELDKDGNTKYFLNNLLGIVEDGKLVSAWGTQRDITAQKTAEHQLKESEERFRALVTATSEVVYRMSPDWTEMRNLEGRGFLSDTGKAIRDWIEKYIHRKDWQRVKVAIEDAIVNKKKFELEHEVIRVDGTLGWTFSRAIPIMDHKGEIIEWFGAASDITARKEAEKALKAAKEESESRKRLYETITSSTPDLIYVFDLNYRFTYANEALLRMWGKHWDEAIGKTLLENGYEAWHAEMHESEIDQVIATKNSVRGEVSFPHATLGRRIYDYIFAPVINENGEVEAIAGTTRDITEIKEAEKVLKQSREKLEALVIERTRELQRSNDDLQQFAHVASHDLKEPVRKVMTFSHRLREELKERRFEKADLFLSKIESSAHRMSSMIDGVLLYSSLNAFEQSKEVIDLNALLQTIKEDLEVPITQKQAQLNFSSLPFISGSSVLMYQLFYNLINNSLKFSSPDKSLCIDVKEEPVSPNDLKLHCLDDKKQFRKIVIYDNGIGFSNDQATKIFGAFARLHSKDKYEGTGLGLALCKKIVERHGGAIHAHGKENEGATFTIFLPEN